ncbi:hypothetical protein GCM10027449_18420 [Sinomonas notoginsengisoli]
MSAMAQRTNHTVPHSSPDHTLLELAATSGPSPASIHPTDSGGRVIGLFAAAAAAPCPQPDAAPHRMPDLGVDCLQGSTVAPDMSTGTLSRLASVPHQSGRAGRRAVHRWAAVRLRLLRVWMKSRAAGQQGMATAEYAIATLGEMSIVRQFSRLK